jgi:hypothetical protein
MILPADAEVAGGRRRPLRAPDVGPQTPLKPVQRAADRATALELVNLTLEFPILFVDIREAGKIHTMVSAADESVRDKQSSERFCREGANVLPAMEERTAGGTQGTPCTEILAIRRRHHEQSARRAEIA